MPPISYTFDTRSLPATQGQLWKVANSPPKQSKMLSKSPFGLHLLRPFRLMQHGYAFNGIRAQACHQPSSGKAKFWLKHIKNAQRLVESRQQEIIDAWNNHFGG